MTPRIYQHGELSVGSEIELAPQASHHLVKVLRARQGDSVILFNGDGNEYAATLATESSKRCSVNITGTTPCTNESPLHITLLQGLSRNDRMDTTLQKVTELGINSIVPVICRHSRFKLDSDRVAKKMAHWRQVIISACEQSGRCVIPEISEPVELESAVASQQAADCRLILAPQADISINEAPSLDERVSVLIGPESGFEDEEVALAITHGFNAITLGPRILRTETAGPAAIAALQTLWGDFN